MLLLSFCFLKLHVDNFGFRGLRVGVVVFDFLFSITLISVLGFIR